MFPYLLVTRVFVFCMLYVCVFMLERPVRVLPIDSWVRGVGVILVNYLLTVVRLSFLLVFRAKSNAVTSPVFRL